ncbi:MAG: hypothetical protein AAF709_20165 [Pseudomonadota bacterium]
MKRTLLAALLVSAGISGGAASLSAETAEVPPSSAFNPIQRFAISYDEPRDIAEFYVREFGLKARDAKFEEVPHPSQTSMRIMLVTAEGLKDDSVEGLQMRLDLRFASGNWEAVEAGMRRKCYRGPNAGEWTRDVCP